MQNAIQLILNSIFQIGVLALTTVGMSLTFKTVYVVNFAQAITSTVGAFMAAFLLRDAGFNAWTSMLGGVAICFFLGYIMDNVIIRNIAGGSGRIMITIGLIVLITAAIPLVFGLNPFTFPRYFMGNLNFSFLGMDLYVSANALFVFLLSAVVIGIIFLALRFTKWGLGVRGTASNKVVASMMGVNTDLMTALSWGISSACGALAAVLYASQTSLVSVTMLATVLANSLLAFIVGGYNSFYGPAIGAALIPVLLVFLAMIDGLWANGMMYILVMLFILVRPTGLFGTKTRKKV
ncbi:MAG: branched-chain amino acid ABC transporter permease [Oscillospiraceae bacterium]|nr:branched-chain amino acid ABC transporter permease [Oscillospiraceae bacterium]